MKINSVRVTRPKHDITTNYLYYWAGLVIKEAESKNIKIIDLKEKRANCKEFTNVVKKINPDLIFLNGHGDSNTVTGHNNQPLVENNRNESILDKKIIYALSCCSAKRLGVKCVKKGTQAYIGYNDDFIFMFEEDQTTHPTQDKTAKLFLKPSNLVVSTLIKNNSPKESYNRSQKAFKKNITSLLSSETPHGRKETLPYLLWDMKHQVCLEK